MKLHKLSATLTQALVVAALSIFASAAQAMVHPGISHSQADLDRMKANVNVEPYKTAFKAFSSNNYAQSTNHGQGPYPYETYNYGQFPIRNDAFVSHDNAIMWYVTGDKAYLTNAITIMNGWARTLKAFDVTDHITAGTAVLDFANAAEIIRSSGNGAWAPADVTAFQNWLVTYLLPPLLTPGNSLAADHLEAANHGGLQFAGLVSMGIFCDRQDIYDFGIRSALHNGHYSYGLQEYVNASGQNYETHRDQGHAAGAIDTFVQTFYMAYNQGQDLYPTANFLLARAVESQAKIDLGYNVAPVTWTAADGNYRNSISPVDRQPYDNLRIDLSYYVFHTLHGLDMPYTLLSANTKFPFVRDSFTHRVDASGKVPLVPLVGDPSPTDVVLASDAFASGDYLVHLAPGSYTKTQLNAAGVIGGAWGNGSNTLRSFQVPVGWTLTLFDGDNFKGNSITYTRGESSLSANNSFWSQRMVSIKIVAGMADYPILNGTFQLVNRKTGMVAAVDSGTVGAGAVPETYHQGAAQLWRVEAQANGQFRLLNLASDLALEVPVNNVEQLGAAVDESTYVPLPDLATGGLGLSNGAASSHPAALAFDGMPATYWATPSVPSAGNPVSLEYQLSHGTSQMVTEYTVTSGPNAQGYDPAAWQFQGLADGTNWVTLDTQAAQVFTAREQVRSYSIDNYTAYGYYRLRMTANESAASLGVQIAELGLYSGLSGEPSQRWMIFPAAGSAPGSFFNLRNAASGGTLDVCRVPVPAMKYLCQWVISPSLLEQWALRVP